jgi:uncharacterized protein YkvS
LEPKAVQFKGRRVQGIAGSRYGDQFEFKHTTEGTVEKIEDQFLVKETEL